MDSRLPVRWLVAAVLLCLAAAPAAAQWKPAVSWAEPSPADISRVTEPADAAPLLHLPQQTRAVDARISSGGRVVLGAAVGAAVGALLFFATSHPCSNDEMFCELEVLSYGAIGALAGGFIGRISSNERRARSSGHQGS